ncbi:Predicted arabinose efflux permease, MFS family [Pseudomonas cuatrocienegasensis]|uniref:Predicted arabinose efflux permease, MFS family n=1 Tax=Pseudomonas cuatrocienegasensis TaxID=543360 RepID=A0ABY1B8Y0_9PSED|nr:MULTISPECIES: MFS transporter [Pseudomonas]OEC35703.1 MFS transporter [Pseudomonas sp. 21C1]SEQ24144.1 Predicted arabinose efflux permease, MFS family [Pseudomonas cuatrocienegasensis]
MSRSVPAKSWRVIWAAAIGNGLITYDFTVYSFSAVIIGKLFFPAQDPLASLLLSLLTFGAGFAMRPLGALVIGHLADRKGRKPALLLSIGLMFLGTGVIAFAPTYEAIGASAMLLMVGARLIQGFAAGGEIGVASVVLMELAPRAQRCFIVSWRSSSQVLAALLGAVVGAALTFSLSPEAMLAWGWRLPFILGLLLGPVGWYLRYHLSEQASPAPQRPSLKRVLTQRARTLWLGIALMAAPTSGIYLLVYYMPTYLVRNLGLSPGVSLLSACASSVAIVMTLPLLARLADRQPRRKPTQYVTLLASMLLVFPVFALLVHGVGVVASILLIAGYSALLMGNNAVMTVMMVEAFAVQERATGTSIMYSVGVTLFGGFCPFIVTWLIHATGSLMVPAWYLLGALCISLYALKQFPEDLRQANAAV